MAAATIQGAKPLSSDPDYAIVHWTLTTADPTGTPVPNYQDYADRTVQGFGTFGAATVELQGSLDGGTTWVVLTDPQGNALTKTAAFLEGVLEAVPLIRAVLTVVGAGATIEVYLFVRKAK